MVFIRRVLPLLFALIVPVRVLAHGGGLDRFGCHTESATGEYHCHGSGTPGENFEPRTNSHLILGGVLASGLSIGFSTAGIFADVRPYDRAWLLGSGIAAAVGSQILQWVLCPIVREESGDDGTDITLAFLGVNSLIIVVDVLYLAGAFEGGDSQTAALLHLDNDGLRVGVPAVQVTPSGALAPIFAHTW